MKIFKTVKINDNYFENILQEEVGVYEMIQDNIRLYPEDWKSTDMKQSYIEQSFAADEDLGVTEERLGELIDAALVEFAG